MTKRLFALTVFFCVASLVFAQASAPKKVLTSKDIDIFVANYPAIEADFAALGDKYDKLLEPEMDMNMSMDDSFSSAVSRARATKVPAEISAILKKHGLGDNGFEKIMVISYGFMTLEWERAIDEQLSAPGMTPEMKSYMAGASEPVYEMKKTIHKDDLALISTKRTALSGVLADDRAME